MSYLLDFKEFDEGYVTFGGRAKGGRITGKKESIGAGHSSEETGSSQDYILMPLWKDGSPFDSSSKDASNDESQPSNDAGKKDDEGGIDDQERTENSAQDVNTAGPSINTASTNFNTGSLNINTISPTVPTALLESTYGDSFGDESELDLSNIATTYPVPTTPNTRIHKDHSLDNVLGDVQSGVQTRRKINEEGWIYLMARGQLEQNRCTETRKMREMDVKSVFLYGKLKEEVYVCQTPGFEDPEFFDKVYKVEKALYGLHQALKAWTSRTQKDDGIFISQDKYVDEILKKFGFSTVKTASTPMETSKPLFKDAEAEDVDRIFRYLKGQPKLGLWYTKDSPFDLEAYTDSDYAGASLDRKSTTRGCQFLGIILISWQCKKQTIVSNSTTEVEYVATASCCGQVLWIQNQMLDYGYNFMNTKIFIDNESIICIVKNLVFHSKTKHIEIRHHFIGDSNEKKLI
ncbi:putative ribonuclease H-like domain-containing protein [Tanacetum coccineum]